MPQPRRLRGDRAVKIKIKISGADWPAIQSMSSHLTDLLEHYADARVHGVAASPVNRTITLTATKGNDDDTQSDS